MAGSVVSSVAQSIGNLLIEEGKFLHGVRDKVRGIQTELNRMQCFLKDADARQNENERIRNWVAEIRDAAYDAEDVIETFALEEASRRRPGMMNVLKRFVCILSEGKALHKVGSEIEVINARISDLTRSLQTYGIKELRDTEGSSSSQREQRKSFPHFVEHNVVGLEDNIKKLVTALISERKQFRVVSICGMGGLGKTTLAKKIYHHTEVRRHFNQFAWSYISKQCQRRDVWEAILLGLTKGDRDRLEKLRDEELAEELHQFLQNNKCLVVLDDIWSIQAWNRLKAAFPDETGSIILLTSRNKDVAFYADPEGFLHEPQCLKDEQSWELFQKIAFSRRDGAEFTIDGRMGDLGKQMVKHCAGLPLAITMLGGLLRRKNKVNQWQNMHDNIKSYITRGNGDGENHSEVFDVFSLSYDDLPLQLKQCFLYLGHFPEDYKIPAEKLIRFWIAEGMITLEQHKTEDVEDAAEGYLEELIERSMVLIGERDIVSSKIVTCRMHDIMRDLCLLKAEKESFLQVINLQPQDENNDVLSPSSSMNGKFCRLAVHLKGNTFSQKHIKGHHHLRSLIYFSTNHWKLLEPTLKNLKVLRVLDLEWVLINGWKFPRDIGELIHLRFLSLRYARIIDDERVHVKGVFELPSSLGNLRLLQTLDLFIPIETVYVPNVIWKMERLRYLSLPPSCDDKTKLQLGTLTNLRTLENFNLEHCNVRDLPNMKNLGVLHIEIPSESSFMKIVDASLSVALNHLKFLALSSHSSPEFTVGISPLLSGFVNLSELALSLHLEKLPEFPPHITRITLNGCHLEEDPMPTLEKLPDLRILCLFRDAFIGREMVCSRQGFSRLHSLALCFLYNLEEWRIDKEAMPNLCKLEIIDCEKLKRLPDNLRFITTLQELTIRLMPKTFKDKLVQGGEDFYKIQHIPSVLFMFDKS